MFVLLKEIIVEILLAISLDKCFFDFIQGPNNFVSDQDTGKLEPNA